LWGTGASTELPANEAAVKNNHTLTAIESRYPPRNEMFTMPTYKNLF
jgi:hypothetical protein